MVQFAKSSYDGFINNLAPFIACFDGNPVSLTILIHNLYPHFKGRWTVIVGLLQRIRTLSSFGFTRGSFTQTSRLAALFEPFAMLILQSLLVCYANTSPSAPARNLLILY